APSGAPAAPAGAHRAAPPGPDAPPAGGLALIAPAIGDRAPPAPLPPHQGEALLARPDRQPPDHPARQERPPRPAGPPPHPPLLHRRPGARAAGSGGLRREPEGERPRSRGPRRDPRALLPPPGRGAGRAAPPATPGAGGGDARPPHPARR